jgi:membrane protein required for colicin V production
LISCSFVSNALGNYLFTNGLFTKRPREMIWVDIVITGIIVISALFSLMRGFVREALSLLGWLVSFWLAITFAGDLAESFLSGISVPSLRVVVAFTIIFVLILVIMTLINKLASQLIKKTGLTGTDRMIGMVFGVVRGALIVSVLVFLAGFTVMPQDLWWQESVLMDVFHEFAVWLRQSVAPEIAGGAIIK